MTQATRALASLARDFRRRWMPPSPGADPSLVESVLWQAYLAGRSSGREEEPDPGSGSSSLNAFLQALAACDADRKSLGAYPTTEDAADWLAQQTILPWLISQVPGLFPGEPDDLLTANVDLTGPLLQRLRCLPELRPPTRAALLRLRVFDPGCGTGALLLAALRLIWPLLDVCENGRAEFPAQILSGLDLSAESATLCRLRLRLALAARARPEELASIPTFNEQIRQGNALLGELPGKFDVVLGNPPYLESREVDYRPAGFRCQSTGAIHALFVERGLQVLRPRGYLGMIVPLSLVSTQRMRPVQELLEKGRRVWYANFSWRPARLFPGVNRALTIVFATCHAQPRTYSTGYTQWTVATRPGLFRRLRFTEVPRARPCFWVPKLSCELEKGLLQKFLAVPTRVRDFLRTDRESPGESRVYHRTDGGLYWKVFTDFAPDFTVDGRAEPSTRQAFVTVRNPAHVRPLIAALSSNLFWWWYVVTSNCRHLNPYDIHHFPLPPGVLADPEATRLAGLYLADLVRHSVPLVRRQRQTGLTRTQSFRVHQSRPLILQIDQALARHYGLNDEEVRFLGNFDLEFRMGGARKARRALHPVAPGVSVG